MTQARKFVSLFVLVGMLLAAIGGGVAAQDEPIELVYWSMWNETEGQALVIQDWIAAFEELHPNITINAVWNGRQNQTLVRTALAGGTVIDIVDQDADQIAGGLMLEGLGLPLNDYLDMPALDEDVPLRDVFLPGTLDLFALDGEVYLLPYIYNTVQFWYDRRIFEEVGVEVPTTWDEFLAVCEALQEAGYAPIAAEGNEPFYSTFYLANMVARIKGPGFLLQTVEDHTGEMWRDPVYLESSQMLRLLWDEEYIPPVTLGYVWPQGQNTLAFGEAGMSLVGSWLPIELSNMVDPDFQWGGFNFPAVEGGVGSANDTQALLLSFMVMNSTEHPDEAAEFLRFIMTQENQQLMADDALVGVTRVGIEWAEAIQDAYAAASTAENIFPDVDGVYANYPEYLNTILGVNYADLWQGNITPEEFVEVMATQSAEYWAEHAE
ncbi:MAG: carbohydrate ABC transporter substrate-binding protein [Anaerolineae bacterium]|nr:carbohydrate ABC transporter substrate-binding protein [Anaerolineae bacterium]